MSSEELDEQETKWVFFYDEIRRVLQGFGSEDYLGRADYLVVDDNYGHRRTQVEVHRLHMLQPEVIHSLRALLVDTADWEITVTVDVPGTEDVWPRMGLTIRKDEVIDGLRREYLPPELQRVIYKDSRPGTGLD